MPMRAFMFLLLACGIAFDDGQNFSFAHDQQFFAVHLHGVTGVLTEDHLVTGFHVQRTHITAIGDFAVTHRDHFAAGRLLGSGTGQHNTAGGLGFFLFTANQHAIMQRTDAHFSLNSQF